MRISIWQQFSSNHSANFEIVGIFETIESAHSAAETLRQIFRAIAKDRLAYEAYCPDCPPTPTEVSLAKQYGLQWATNSLDWLILDNQDVRNVRELDQFVFITNLNVNNTWIDAAPIDQLVKIFGGDVVVTGEFHADEITIDISCKAPDEASAIRLYDQFQAYWTPKTSYGSDPLTNYELPPWINFWEGGAQKLSNIWPQNVEALVKKYLTEDLASKQYLAEHAETAERLTHEIDQASQVGDQVRVQELLNERFPHINFIPPEGADLLSPDQARMAIDATFDTALGGDVNREGQELTITGLPNFYIGSGLPALIRFLRSQGCTEIDYKVSIDKPGGE